MWTKLVSLTLVLTAILTGCGSTLTGENGSNGAEATVDRSAYTTPESPRVKPTPTPFALLEVPTVAPTTTSTPVVDAQDPKSDTAEIDEIVVTAPLSSTIHAGGGSETPAQLVSRNSETAAPDADQANVAVCSAATLLPGRAAVVAPADGLRELDMLRGPGTQYEPIVRVFIEDQVSVLALNPAGDWALVRPVKDFQAPGWIALRHLRTETSPDGLPRVTTGWIQSNAVALMGGPGIFTPQVGKLARNDMMVVIGKDDANHWACVSPVLGGGSGWITRRFIALGRDWNELPVVDNPAAEVTANGMPPAARAVVSGQMAIQLGTGGDIYLVNVDGTGLRRITHGIDPALSSDGAMIAVTRWEGDGATSSLWVVNVKDGNERAILGEMTKAKGPAWSPDGSRIAVNYQGGGYLDDKGECVLLIDMNTGKVSIPSVPTNAYNISKRFKGGLPYLCYHLPPDARWKLRVVDVATGTFEDIDGGSYAFRPTWNPGDSAQVVCDSGYGLLATEVDHQETKNITNAFGDGSPVFSPDGRTIALVANQNNTYDIHRINADGSGRLSLTKTPLWVTATGDVPWSNVAPAWSPDGSFIAFLTNRTGEWQIWLMGADGSDPHPMFSDEINAQLPITYEFNDERVISWQ